MSLLFDTLGTYSARGVKNILLQSHVTKLSHASQIHCAAHCSQIKAIDIVLQFKNH